MAIEEIIMIYSGPAVDVARRWRRRVQLSALDITNFMAQLRMSHVLTGCRRLFMMYLGSTVARRLLHFRVLTRRSNRRLVESIMSDGRLYLCGDSISAADIAFASLAFPLILPEETAGIFVSYDPRSLPRGYVELIKRCA